MPCGLTALCGPIHSENRFGRDAVPLTGCWRTPRVCGARISPTDLYWTSSYSKLPGSARFMESNTQSSGGAPRTSTGLPYVPATQAGALLRSGLAIASELMGNAFSAIGAEALETFASRWYLEPKEQFVQRLLDSRKAELKGAFMQRLRENQDAALAALLNRGNAAKVDVHAESLSLLDVVTVSSNTFVTSSANRMRGLVEEPMRDLHLIVNFLSGRQQIRISDDPFGPNVFMQALLAAGEDQALNAEAWEHFLSVFEKPMGEEIARIHMTLLEHFARHGLQPATMRREFVAQQAAQRAASHARVPAQPGAPAGQAAAQANAINDALAGLAGAAAAAGALGPMDAAGVPVGFRFDAPRADPGLVLNNLLRRLQANAHDIPIAASPRQGPPDAGLFSAIGELQQLGLQGLAGATLAAGPDTNISSWREHLVGKSSRTVDKLTIELVGMLFEQVMRDNQVPSEIKALLSRLQFPVLKAALLDADIFTSSTHPARRLIDRIASTASGWEPYGDENERYRAQVEHIVKEVLQVFDKDITIFERLLNEFDQFVS